MIEKRFPADIKLDELLFLNNKQVDGELYAYFQSISEPKEIQGEMETIVEKKKIPKQTDLCAKLGYKAAKTYRAHLNWLIDGEYIIDCGNYYLLPRQEEIFFMIPLDTLQFIVDNLREHVIKLYIYLGQRWKYKGSDYTFTLEELGEHLGIQVSNYSRGYEKINNALEILSFCGLISYHEERLGKKAVKKLDNFSYKKGKF